ncbi:MAG: phosphoribosylaminoimidazolecarboxamide formyltransferase [SAR324 cluster bacterium]|jgi:phosphoribosylaminoimidazolecarboxamide formyltransferase/IMP cyclohydrolase|nr:phosphoribosylaminoimidazolecarboxamide formyltransferase [SAR324 cluster bacterium]MCH2265336.1 phosphoribosylaminoimidazolecarboxamide formyltransferase [SAR324 cluster bacterium]|tara:strand:+ start:1430 stop:2629 length:1200 start_codon:yes stop_codon:yes gene_type:complete
MASVQKNYLHQFDLKYGSNPHQKPAAIYSLNGDDLPFAVLNGQPGYINLLDALNACQLVVELDEALGLPAATSFKHVSPAGAAVNVPLDDTLREVYACQNQELTPLATAYIRARGADPLSSFGDFIGLSRKVDLSTAEFIRKMVSDGIIAPGYDEDALKILKEKKGGKYIILQSDPEFIYPELEFREVAGVVFSQLRNTININENSLLTDVVTKNKTLTAAACRDLVLASITLKYTQSNSVAYALDGQMIGIGAGQQSRVDCTKLAGRKADTWFLRQYPHVRNLPFREPVGSVERTNARILCIEGGMTPPELRSWKSLFDGSAEEISMAEKKEWLTKLKGVSLSSDAFFPFRDNIDQASKRGVKYVVQPGGSNRDEEVISAADEYGMVMLFSGIRLFHH